MTTETESTPRDISSARGTRMKNTSWSSTWRMSPTHWTFSRSRRSSSCRTSHPFPAQSPGSVARRTFAAGAVPIIDLRERCNVAVNEYTAATRIVVVTSGSGLVGFIVDGVSEVLRIPAADVDAISNIASTSGNRYLRGVAKLVAGLVSLMDLDALIPSDIAETETSVA